MRWVDGEEDPQEGGGEEPGEVAFVREGMGEAALSDSEGEKLEIHSADEEVV